ncbi:E3 ubiquitin-protein ligase Topors-like isoform X2 [Sinocyclocheilus grahami]|uniref:E3 ubiquitin-protein ligase Topors-like isoform X2 n=1 Tax=Sinocyclocheilus grahami TaxID=75366 RepID=UPI0007AC8C32|nr:PREDICTED: E3 ubiquitin-protein ligase Topors-like isoform X2 [Sinocyclocheilus grahami]
MASPQMKERPSGAVLNTISKGASPESKCPICLDHFKNISYLDVCLHKFCFCCIREWSKNKAECPLCKQPFNSIYHTIKSEDNYQRFDLRPTENGSFGNMAGQRFRYRTTLTGERRLAPRRTSSPPDHGVLFEDLRGSVPQRHNRDLHSMLRRLAEERQRREREGRSLRSLHEQQAVKFRRALYRRGVRVQNVQDGGRSRETSAEFFRRNPACLHRLVPWVRRELAVLYGTHGSLVNIVQHIIMTLITRHNLDEQAVLHELRPFLLTHTEHFLHEFLSFARSPFNMEAYDQRAVYDLPRASGESSRSETSVIAISEDESDSLVSGSQDYATPSVTLSQAPWDDETPGPSYSSSQVLPFHVRDSDSDSSVGEAVVSVAAVPHQDRAGNPGTVAVEEEHSSGSDEDCMIIGHVKPVSERTPELVLLSSDSEQNAEPQSPRAPQHNRFTSESDLSPADAQRRPTRCSRSPENTSTRSRRDKCGKRHHERELSGSRERSSCSNRTHSSSRGRKHPLSKESKHKRRREKESSRHTSSYWHSYSHYSQKDSSRRCYTETCSSYTSYYRSVHRSRSRSHGRRQSRDSQDRSHSSSQSRIKPSSSNRQDRSRSKSRSRINSSNRQDRSRSKSRSRIDSSIRQDRSHSSSRSRIKPSSSNHQDRSRLKSRSRINSSNRQDRSCSRSNSRINSSNRQDRSRLKSRSRINSSNRQDRSHSSSRSRINSNSHQTSHHDEHGRKKKYKTKHHEEPTRKSSSQLFTDSVEDGAKKKIKKHKKFKRKSRSPSIDDRSEDHSRNHHKKKKKKHKRKSRRHSSEETVGKNSPVLITIPSDSDAADPSEPSARNISAADSTVTIASSATETQPLDGEQESAAGTECSSVGDAGNRPQTCVANQD